MQAKRNLAWRDNYHVRLRRQRLDALNGMLKTFAGCCRIGAMHQARLDIAGIAAVDLLDFTAALIHYCFTTHRRQARRIAAELPAQVQNGNISVVGSW